MIKDDIKIIIDWTLKYLNMHSDDASALIYRTGMAETKYNHLKQMGDGPALGFFQCEPNTMKDIMENYVSYRDGLKQKIYYLGYNDDNPEMSLMSNVALQVAFCRIKYRRDRLPIPNKDKIEEQAKYWKRVYNTRLGKGTVEHFLSNNKLKEK
tara:strand:+ start:1913 stop:2371 length:459 start_codon:yes stop_codon:yes gene_type:complete